MDECLGRLGMLKRFPLQERVVIQISKLLNELCQNDAEAQEFVSRVVDDHDEWPGPSALIELHGQVATRRSQAGRPAGCEVCRQGYAGQGILTCLRSVFEAAEMWGYSATRNPCKRIKLGSGGPVRDLRPLEPSEARALLGAITEEPLRLITETVLYTGLRIGEVLGLTWGAVDARRCVLEVRQSKSQEGVFDTPKSAAGRRPVKLGHLAAKFVRPDTAKSSDLIWPDVMYHPLQKKFVERAKAAGIEFEGFGFHTLRRTHATLRHLIGIVEPSRELMRDMGHSSGAMTARYVRQNETGVVEKLRNLIDSSGETREQEATSNVVSIGYKEAS